MAAPPRSSPPRPRAFQRLIARGARLLARGLYRSVEVDNPEPGWSWRPAILTVNHPTGLSDPALLLGLLERSPRFLAKATLWDTPGFGWLLNRLGAIPVYRAQDGSTDRNAEMFTAAFDALAEGYLIAIFPEGGVSEAPSLGPIKTGTARLALGAQQAGVEGLLIVPVGIHFEKKAGLRNRVYVQVGDVLDMDGEIGRIARADESAPDEHTAVARLTAEIESRLRAAAPDYATDEEAGTLAFAADVLLREPGSSPISFARRQRVAARLGRAETTDQQAMVGAAAHYRRRLGQHEVSDHEVMLTQGGAKLRRRFAALLVLLIVLAPFALAGVVMNILPLAGLLAAMRRSVDAMTAATVRTAGAVAAFLLMWLVWAALAWNVWDWRVGLVALIAAPLYGAVAVFTIDRSVEWWRDWTGRRRAQHLGRALGELVHERAALVATIEKELA